MKTLYRLADEVSLMKFGALTNGYSLIKRVESLIDETLPQNAHEIAYRKVYISVTRLPSKVNCLISEFETRQHLIQV